MHGRAEYFDRGAWNKVDDPVLDDFKLSGTCVAGSTELDAGYLIGNSWSLLQRQKRYVIYYVKKFIKESQ